MGSSSFKRLVPTNQGLVQDILVRGRLIYRLMRDNRVNNFLKILPVASLVYLISPVDLMPFLPFDDIAVVGMGMYMFVELCPQFIVEEHLTNLRLNIARPFQNSEKDELIVDGEVVEDEGKS
jgi:uncharacterized membrane protein YkvA (DUF1232 family)